MFSVDVSAMRHTNGWPLDGISLVKLCEETLPKCSQDFPGLSETTSTEMQCKPLNRNHQPVSSADSS